MLNFCNSVRRVGVIQFWGKWKNLSRYLPVLSPRLMYARTFRAMEGRGSRIFNVHRWNTISVVFGNLVNSVVDTFVEIIGVFLFFVVNDCGRKEGNSLERNVRFSVVRTLKDFGGMGSF